MRRVVARFLSSSELVARLERNEAGLIAGAAAAASARLGPGAVEVLALAGGVAVHAGAGAPFNKLAGLGFDGVPAEAALTRVEELFDARATPVRVELASHADPAVGRALSRRGYVLAGFEDVLARDLGAGALPALPVDIEVRPSPDSERAAWLDLLVEGFAHPDPRGVASDESFPRDVLESALVDMAALAGLERQIALWAGRPAGAASVRIAAGVATLCGAATLPERRGRGVQTALLAWRLARAREAGCDLAVVTTQPGSTSQHNVLRQGFHLAYTRAVLVRGG
jgi:GNAT superfamily N-acetyltransferase